MSSFVVHALVGASCIILVRPKLAKQTLPFVVLAGLLGISPDIDYLLLWLAEWRPTPRITHSLVFVAAVSLLTWLFTKVVFYGKANFRLLLVFFAAAASHLVLDALVGTDIDPTFWPFSSEGLRSPIGLLPSAGKLDLYNFYFWRNLLIELGIIVPSLSFAYCLARKGECAWQLWRVLVGLSVFVTSVYISIGLSR